MTKKKNLILSVLLVFLFTPAGFASEGPMCTLSKPKVQKEKNITIYEYEVTCASAIKMESLAGKLDIEKTAAFFQVMKDCFKSQKKTGCFKDKIDIEAEIKILNTSDWAKVKAKKFNSLIGAMGYRFEAEGGKPDSYCCMNLYKNNKLILEHFSTLDIAVNVKKNRLVFVTTEGSQLWFDSGKVKKSPNLWYGGPWFLGDSIVIFVGVPGTLLGKVTFAEYSVIFDGKEIFRYKGLTHGGTGADVLRFYVKNNHWILESTQDKDVIVDGVSLTKKYGYKKVFQYTYIKRLPFYFFAGSSNKIRIKYGDKTLQFECDDVAHALTGIYSFGAFHVEPRITDNSIRFFARRGNKMLYVEIK